VHSEWSWDAAVGDMERTCARAVAIGLPALAFTEHLDQGPLRVALEGPYASDFLTSMADPSGVIQPPGFDVDGYLAAIDHCRSLFPALHILSGVEFGEPHRHTFPVGRFDRVLGSLHTLPDRGTLAEPFALFPHRDPPSVLREYLAEVARMMSMTGTFSILAHIDYPARFWPGPFAPADFEDEFRHALRLTAASGRALEINTKLPLHATLLRWWREEGGTAVSFGSDAHSPDSLAHGFADAAAMAEAHGFRPGPTPYALWGRSG
jgi:histidinol-phosphatase (PHP family)